MEQIEIPTLSPIPNPMTDLKDYLPIVRSQAKQIHRRLPQTVDIDDLYSAGQVGLWQACIKYDSAKNVSFAAYARFRVRGAILDSLRSLDWAPRGLRSKQRAAQEAIRTLSLRLARTPTEDEVANALNLSNLEYRQLLGDLHGLEIGSLYRHHDEGSSDEELVYVADRQENDPLFRCLRGELTERLSKAIEALPERQRLVITLYYYEELTLQAISEVLEMSVTRVQQIRAKVVLYLRELLSDLELEFGVPIRESSESDATELSASSKKRKAQRNSDRRVSVPETIRNMEAIAGPCMNWAQATRDLSPSHPA